MAELVNNAIEYHRSPISEPPRIDFSYTPSHESSAFSFRGDSDRILAETLRHTDDVKGQKVGAPAHGGEIDRPRLAKRNGTEVPRPVGVRPVVQNRRNSTGARPSNQEPFANAENSSSSSESDYFDHDPQETPVDLSGSRSRPDHADIGAKELNRARMRPWKDRRKPQADVSDEFLRSRGKTATDGRLNVRINDTINTGYLAKALGSAIQGHLHPHAKQAHKDAEDLKEQYVANKAKTTVPRMNIVIMVIGSRGDVQPFLKIGQILRDKYGHRVRIATHPAFRAFVQDEIGLEFFSIGGDPAELMSFMVRNPGLIPSFETISSGEVGRRRDQMLEMFNGFWRACVNTTDDEKDTANLALLGDKAPFIADAIIANPVSFAHYHCAERLRIPLHLVFTFPYTPTKSFPHPLANIKASNVDREYTNYMSYPLVDLMTWQGLGDLVNRFRVKTLGLEPLSTLWAPGQLTRMRVPMTYLWSPGLVPKPEDWGPEIDIAGYVFLDLAKAYKPPADLAKFLKRSEEDTRPIIYIGFGSISGIKDARAFCQLIFDSTVQANVRAVVSRGWGGMGDGMDIPDCVFMIDNVPHDWLFPQLDAVVHHGGAGTTAIGLKLGLPTMIVPFFGDQPFWADMIARARAGAREVWPLKKLTVERFATSISQCLEPESKENAQAIGKSIDLDGDGAENAVDSFHRSLDFSGKHSMRCAVFDDRVSVWKVHHTGVKLSALAADLLVENEQLHWDDLGLVHHKKWRDFSGPGEPVTGVGGVVVSTFQETIHGMTSIHETTRADWKRLEKRRRKRKGQTIADAITFPAKVVQHARGGSTEATANDNTTTTVNLTGDAEPVRKMTIPGVNSDHENGSASVERTQTTSSLQGHGPVILAKDVGQGFGHSMKAVLLLPLDMLNAVTLGFRNAPRLYGDRTVRPPPQDIKGFRQGLRVAGKEFWLGVYDGTTGLVRIPHLDVQEEGVVALPKGMARGLGGLVLKPVAGTLGLVNYTNKGAYATLRRIFRDTEKTDRWIRRTRLAQGAIEVKELADGESDVHKDDGRVPHGSDKNHNKLEDARARALTRWTTHDRKQLEEARAKDRRSMGPLRPRLSTSES